MRLRMGRRSVPTLPRTIQVSRTSSEIQQSSKALMAPACKLLLIFNLIKQVPSKLARSCVLQDCLKKKTTHTHRETHKTPLDSKSYKNVNEISMWLLHAPQSRSSSNGYNSQTCQQTKKGRLQRRFIRFNWSVRAEQSFKYDSM